MLSRGLESKILSITLSTPSSIQETAEEEARNGWEMAALGSNFAFFVRERGAEVPQLEYKVESITLSTPSGIQDMLNELGEKGWAIAGAGPSFVFLKRCKDRTTQKRAFELESVTLSGVGAIQELIDKRAAAGWGLATCEASFAIFEKMLELGTGTLFMEHLSLQTKMESITLTTPGGIQTLLDEHAKDGWAICAAAASFLFFRKLADGAPATRPLAETRTLGAKSPKPKLPADRPAERDLAGLASSRQGALGSTSGASRTASGGPGRGRDASQPPSGRKLPNR